MSTYATYGSGEARSGIPLGGLGAGVVVLDSTGAFRDSTLQNNMTRPITDLPGNFLAIWAAAGSEREAYLLQSSNPHHVPGTSVQSYEGRFPFVHMTYRTGPLPLSISLEAFSPFIPGDARHSAIPAALFTLKIRNLATLRMEVATAFSWENDLGLARMGHPVAERKLRMQHVTARKRAPGLDGLEMRLPWDRDSYAIAVLEDPRLLVTVAPVWDPRSGEISWWDRFAASGTLPGPGSAESLYYRAGAVAARTTLEPDEERAMRFILAWYQPDLADSAGKVLGHKYEEWYDGAWQVASDTAAEWEQLERGSRGWQERLLAAGIPDWLEHASINCLYALSTNSWWVKDGRFAISESPLDCPIMETTVCRFNGSFPLAQLFPDLEANTMRQFVRWQAPSGEIPFAFGRPEFLNSPYYGVQHPLCSAQFALMVYRDAVWSGDACLLAELYPAARRALEYAKGLDQDGDCLVDEDPTPDNANQYYDNWPWYGTSAYVASTWLAALKAGEAMAVACGDGVFAGRCREWFSLGLAAFERKLWNGRYFDLYYDEATGSRSTTCLTNQLVGQWYAYMLGLDLEIAPGRIQSTIRSVERLNFAGSPWGPINGVRANGKPDVTTLRARHSNGISPGEAFAFAAMALYAGEVETGLNTAKRMYDTIALNSRTPWNTRFNYDAETGREFWGDHYYSNMAAWTLLPATAGLQIDLLHRRLRFRPAGLLHSIPLLGPHFNVDLAVHGWDGGSPEIGFTNHGRDTALEHLVLAGATSDVRAAEWQLPNGERLPLEPPSYDPEQDELRVTGKLALPVGTTRLLLLR